MARLVVVGLGPAGADHLLPVARAALLRVGDGPRFVRTRRHPAVADLEAEGLVFDSFDEVYDAASDLETAYAEMVDRLVGAVGADAGDVVYAVPGSPTVAERTVGLLTERGVLFDVVPGVSFADLAWARIGLDAMTGAVVDARAIDEAEMSGPTLIAQCDHALVLSDVKLAMLEHLGPETPVIVLQRLGTPDEHVEVVELVDLDRGVVPDHLTTLFVDAPPGASSAAREVARLLQLARRLRDPGGCPWDAEQTHASLTRYLVEEAYEVVEVVGGLPDPAASRALEDELGDVLYQVVFHALIAEDTGQFTMADVARGIHDKLVRRHPHVFGDVVADESDEIVRNWEQIKKDEKGSESIVEGIPPSLPALLYTTKLYSKASSVGLDPGSLDEALDRVEVAVERLRAGTDVDADLGGLLAAAVVIARATGVDGESALRNWAARYRARFESMERLAIDRGVDLATADRGAVAALWLEAAARV